MPRSSHPGATPQPEIGVDTPDAGDYTAAPGADTLILMSAAHAFGQAQVVIGALPIGAQVIQAWVEVTQAYNGGTNVLTVGYVGSTSAYLGAADVTEGTPAVYPTGGKGPFPAETAARSAVVAYTQTGAPATTGAARAYLQVRMP